VVALLGRDVRIGVAGTRAAAAMASARVPGSGGVLLVEPGQERRFMEPLPVGALDGIGPKQAATLERFGLTTVGQLAATPSATVERILGRKAGRVATERARGLDMRRVVPTDLPASASVRHRFDRDELDGPVVRAALLQLAVEPGGRQTSSLTHDCSCESCLAPNSDWVFQVGVVDCCRDGGWVAEEIAHVDGEAVRAESGHVRGQAGCAVGVGDVLGDADRRGEHPSGCPAVPVRDRVGVAAQQAVAVAGGT
jgi:hypothetical protein